MSKVEYHKPTTYTELEKVQTKERADAWTHSMGWVDDANFEKETGDSLVGYWIDVGISSPPSDAKKRTISPVAVIVHSRLFPSSVEALVKGDTAWVKDEDWESLF